jgi:hypothetical protein
MVSHGWSARFVQSEETEAILNRPGTQHMAGSFSISVAKWVRTIMKLGPTKERVFSTSKKLEAVRSAVGYDYPSGDIDRMLSEIESGYLSMPE